ncbi:MAG: hypothetical protein KAI27_05635 [Rhodospirillaceae bacterium]|nr:hypothetical protein [Rhodospirillaceae bacterium]
MLNPSPKYIMILAIAIMSAMYATGAAAAGNSPEIPFLDQWSGSPHANAKSESFRHWDKDGEVPKACAKCHSSDGFKDFLGADGSAEGVVDSPAPTTSVITCTTCHNDAGVALDSVTFPSGLSIANAGSSARCMECHQGRQSGANVDKAVAGMSPDAVSDKLKFLNVHYRAAAATLWGGKAKIGYEYAGIDYQGRAEHWKSLNECVECHDPHGLEVRVETCVRCHENVTDVKSLRGIRWAKTDFDGDGDKQEGISGEIATMHEKLLATIQVYGKKVSKPIAYDAHAYPYFFYDSNANGVADKKEAVFKNQYKSWTPRLLKAAYNYQFVAKDTGAYTHNSRYVMQLLFDSIADLSSTTKTDVGAMVRP